MDTLTYELSAILSFIIFLIIKMDHHNNVKFKVKQAMMEYKKHNRCSMTELKEMVSSIRYRRNAFVFLFDWDCQNIVPAEVYDKIKNYL